MDFKKGFSKKGFFHCFKKRIYRQERICQNKHKKGFTVKKGFSKTATKKDLPSKKDLSLEAQKRIYRQKKRICHNSKKGFTVKKKGFATTQKKDLP